MYKQFVLLFVTINCISSIQSLPSFRWRRSDSPLSTSNSKFIDFSFFQSLPKYVFGPLRRSSQPNEFISFNSLDTPINRFDSSYNAYETISNDNVINIPTTTTMKKSSPPIQNELNDIYSTNESYEDDDVIVIPFTKHRGPAKFGDLDNKFPNAKNEHGVPNAVGFDPNQNQVINNNKNLINDNKKFDSKIITDSEDDLDTGDELPSSLGTDDESSQSSDFKVQFSDLHPIYVKPPKSFQPVLYPNREIDGVDKLTKRIDDNQATIKPILTDEKQELPNKYPNGLSSWILGGSRSMQRGSFWESLGNDESLHGYKPTATNVDNKKSEIELNSPINSLEDDKSLIKSQADNNLEFISLNEQQPQPKSRSLDNDELKQEKKVTKLIKKAHLISKFKSSSSLSKSKLQLKRNLTAKKVKILSKANKFFDKNVKKLN